MPENMLAIHLHFYQPPRNNPITGSIGSERSAAPYRNWNERAAEEVYRPNVRRDNFQHISFDISDSLLEWLHTHTQETYQRIQGAVTTHHNTFGMGNVLGTPLYHAPLPSLSAHHQRLQLQWGRDMTRKRFGYIPQGLSLPAFGADEDSLQAAVDAGFSYTLLHADQVEGVPKRGGAGPYRLCLKSGDSIDVFIINNALSQSLLDEMTERGGAGFWARRALAPYVRAAGPLTLLHLDGGMVGKHKMAEAQFIHYLLRHEAPAAAFQPITLEHYYRQVEGPICEIGLKPYTPEPLGEIQRVLHDALLPTIQAADALFGEALGDNGWDALANYYAQKPTNHHALHKSQFALQRAWANMLNLEAYPQLGLEHILNDVALADGLLQSVLDSALTQHFTPHLAEHTAEKYHKLLDAVLDRHSNDNSDTANTLSQASKAAGA